MKKSKPFKNKHQCYYIPKFYRGVPVVTLFDMAHFTDIPIRYFFYYIKQHKNKFIKGIDYWYLKSSDLTEFLNSNQALSANVSSIFIMTSPGLMKLNSIVNLHQNMGGRGGQCNTTGNTHKEEAELDKETSGRKIINKGGKCAGFKNKFKKRSVKTKQGLFN